MMNSKLKRKVSKWVFFFVLIIVGLLVIVKVNVMLGYGKKEKFYTLFQPYHYKSDMIKKYVDMTTSVDYNYKPLILGISQRENYISMYEFMVELLKMIMANSPILTVDIMKFRNSKDICLGLINKDINMGIVSSPILIDAITGFNNIFDSRLNFNSLRFIANIGEQYIFIVMRKDSKIKRLQDLVGKSVGIDMKNSTGWKVAQDIFEFLKLKHGKPRELFAMPPLASMYALLNKKLDAMIYIDYYPSMFINNIFQKYDIEHQLNLLPVDNEGMLAFRSSFYYYHPSVVDLNKMPRTFLHTKVGNQEFTKFNADLATFKFDQIIVATHWLDVKTVYNFTKQYYQNVYNSKDTHVMGRSRGDLFKLSIDRSMLFIHEGAYLYYKEMGYIVDNRNVKDDKKCVELIGKTVCNDRNITKIEHSIVI